MDTAVRAACAMDNAPWRAVDLVGRAAVADTAARRAEGRFLGLAIAMEAEDRAEGAIFKPADQQFVEIRIVGNAAMETADIGGPPGDAGETHIQPGGELVARAGRIDRHDAATAQMLRERYGARVRILSAKAEMISSTEIRARLTAGLPVEGMLDAAVEAIRQGENQYTFPFGDLAFRDAIRRRVPDQRCSD